MDFAMKAEPLTQLTKKGEPENINWTNVEEEHSRPSNRTFAASDAKEPRF